MQDEGILSFIDRLASNEPTPGGGAAAGLAGSMGAGAMLMSIRFSTNSKKLTEEDVEALNKAIETLENSKTQFTDLVTKDEEGFKPLSAAYKLPSETDEEKDEKKKAVQKGLSSAIQAPLETIQEAEKVVRTAEEVLPLIKRFIISDIGVGLQLVRSALNASKLNVYINADLMTDEEIKEKHLKVADDLVNSLNEKIDSLFETIEDKIRKQ